MDGKQKPKIYGLMAEFDNPTAIVEAAKHVREEGYRHIDGYSPYPLEELIEALGVRRSRLPYFIFGGGLLGGLTGYFMQYYLSAFDYPLNVGGKPLNSWPQFIPITFELTVLFAAFTAVFGMIVANGLPRPYHPVFNVPRFELASRNRFFLVIEASDGKFDYEKTAEFMKSLNAVEVSDVEP